MLQDYLGHDCSMIIENTRGNTFACEMKDQQCNLIFQNHHASYKFWPNLSLHKHFIVSLRVFNQATSCLLHKRPNIYTKWKLCGLNGLQMGGDPNYLQHPPKKCKMFPEKGPFQKGHFIFQPKIFQKICEKTQCFEPGRIPILQGRDPPPTGVFFPKNPDPSLE